MQKPSEQSYSPTLPRWFQKGPMVSVNLVSDLAES